MEIERYVHKPELRPAVGELKKHSSELGQRFVFFDNNVEPNGDMYIIMRKVVDVKSAYEPAEPRKHTVDAYMLFFGMGEDLRGLQIEILIDDARKTYESPVSVFIPKNTLNSYKILKGSGFYMKLVKAKNGDYNKATY